MNLNERILAIREGGQTQRCHTLPHSGEYNVATHSYNALSLLFLLYPGEPSQGLVKAVLWHDVPERWTGDVPAPAKWASPVLKNILDSLEDRIFEKLELLNIFTELSEEEQNWLTAVDLLELYIWGKEQEALGNQSAKELNKRVIELVKKKQEKIPKKVWKFIKNFNWSRTPECNQLLQGDLDEESQRASG